MYAQVVRPQQKALELEEQFVRLLIVNMSDVDIGLFDFDFDTTFSVLALNSEGQVYLRFGGRDSKSAESFVSLPAFEKSLSRGLNLHQQWQAGELKLPPAGQPKSAQSFEFVANVGSRRCIHCHDVASGQAIELLASPDFSLQRDIWIYPEPASLGLELDPDDGNTLLSVTGPAAEIELQKGDQITALNQNPTSTFSDIQHYLHHLPKNQTSIELSLADGRNIELPLPEEWRNSNITWRRIGLRLSPSAGFGGTPLPETKKAELEIPESSFATRVSFFDYPRPINSPLQEGDIVYSVNEVTSSPQTTHAALYINLNHQIGDTVELGVIRNGRKQSITLVISEPPSQDRRIMNGKGKGGGKKGKGRRGRFQIHTE